jgi:rifampicin phosphotransferase
MRFIKSLNELGKNDLNLAGGKGANLGALIQAGFPVPLGFCLTTGAYCAFVVANRLDEEIQHILQTKRFNDPTALENTSSAIRTAFAAGLMPADIQDEILSAYASLNSKSENQNPPLPVAVRSSATAEDLTGLSFAGQQDTYLNIVGEQELLQAVLRCWSSLWTARAIGYRARNNISQGEIALAVVVQEMSLAEASGVLFTANPVSGLRTEMVIDATLGLGEALVAGQVEPDHYVVSPDKGCILSKTLGTKAIVIHGLPGGGTSTTQQNRGDLQALADEQILELGGLGQRIEQVFGGPQDIEWTKANGHLFIVQSRPITSLFPLPARLPAEPLKVLFSFGAVQGMLDPVTPLGIAALKLIFATGAGLFGIKVTAESQSILYVAAERLWVNFTAVLSNSVGRRIVPIVLNLVEPTIRQAVEQISNDPRLQPGRPGISFHARSQIARFAVPLVPNILLNLAAPQGRRTYIIKNGEKILASAEAQAAAIQGDRWEMLAQRANLLPNLAASHLPRAFTLFVSGVAAGMASWNFLNMLTADTEADHTSPAGTLAPQPSTHDLVLEITRGMPYNPTTEMDLALWKMAKEIHHDPASSQVFQINSPTELSARYLAGDLPEITWNAISQFLGRYGGRGLGEIDLGRTRWAEDPTHVFEMLSSFLQIEDETLAPDVVFARGADSAQQAVSQLAERVRKNRRGWLKARLVRFFAGRARQLMGARESPKFFAVRMMWIIHRELLKSGQDFVQSGDLAEPDDLFYLSWAELKSLAARQEKDWRGLIAERRETFQREQHRRQIPRLLLSDGRAFYEGLNTPDLTGNIVTGSPVSPGSAQGRVRVVLDPRQAHLQPGEILVCPGTDPSWTPLFLSAAGLVMEVGGMMTHGAVVAREYGIPAIVGVDRATLRLETGKLIHMDGSSGRIELL